MARLFDDVLDQYLYYGTPVVGGTPLTLACWFNVDSATQAQGLMGLRAEDANDYQGYALFAQGAIPGDPVPARSRGPGGSADADTSTGFSINTWHHACGIFASDSDRRVYIDGGSKNTDAIDVGTPNMSNTTFGAQYTWTGAANSVLVPTSGNIGEAVVLRIAATDYQVWLHAQGVPAPLIWPGWAIAGYWPLFETDRDFPAGNYNMTPVNAPDWAPHPPKVLEYWRRYQARAVATQTTQTRIAPWTWVDWSPEGYVPGAPAAIPLPIISDRGIHSAIHGGQVVR